MNKLYEFCTNLVENIRTVDEKSNINNHIDDMKLIYDEDEDCCYILWGEDDKVIKLFESSELYFYNENENYEGQEPMTGIVITNEEDIANVFLYHQEGYIMAFTIALYCAAVTEIILSNIRMNFN